MSEHVEPVSTARRISHYSTLGVAEHASQEEIRDAYRRAVQRCHPDRFQGVPAAEATFKEITVAYKALRDPRSRREYDRRLGLAPGRRLSEDAAPATDQESGHDEVGSRDLHRFENLADGHARRGLDAPKIASHLIAEGSPYQLAWHLAWRARRRHLSNAFVSGADHYGTAPQPVEVPAQAQADLDRGGNWQESRDRHRRPFQVLMSRLGRQPR